MSESDKKNESINYAVIGIKSIKFFGNLYESAILDVTIGVENEITIRGVEVGYEEGLLVIRMPYEITTNQDVVGFSLEVLYTIKSAICDWLCKNPAFRDILIQKTTTIK